jgi:hypothetical protein
MKPSPSRRAFLFVYRVLKGIIDPPETFTMFHCDQSERLEAQIDRWKRIGRFSGG